MNKRKIRLGDVAANLECAGQVAVVFNGEVICNDTAYNILSNKKLLSILEYTVECITATEQSSYKVFVQKE